MTPDIYVGTSGWHYSHWRGLFYPEKMPAKDWLGFYARHFNTVEVNASFYRLLPESTFQRWHSLAPPGFCFSLKAGRYITHLKKLQDCRQMLQDFTGRALNLKEHLGPILYQLPPGFHRDDAVLEGFLSCLAPSLRHVFEFRDISWMQPEVWDLLRRYNCGFCIFDMPGYTSPLEVTSGFSYVRFHGKDHLYGGSYPDDELKAWTSKLAGISRELKDIYIYFNNDAEGFAIQNAMKLREYLQS